MADDRRLLEVVEELEQGLPPAANSGFLGARLDSALAKLVLKEAAFTLNRVHRSSTARSMHPTERIRRSFTCLDLHGRCGSEQETGGMAKRHLSLGPSSIALLIFSPRYRAIIRLPSAE